VVRPIAKAQPHPTAFTVATLATTLRDLERVRDGLQARACTHCDPEGELVPLLGRTCLAIQTLERVIAQLEEEP
jgi:hypothetical protein